jgi:phosphatidylinositol alpha-1,6-mannosyltransferase
MPNVPVADDMEGFGIVLLEAGQCGTPAIAAQLEGIQDVVTDGVNGHLVPPEDPSAFADAIRPYRDAPEALDAAAQRAMAHTENTFGWPAVAEKYLATLRTLTSQGRPPPTKAPVEVGAVPQPSEA